MEDAEHSSRERQKIGRANRVRFACAGLVWVFYFGYTLAYTGFSDWFAAPIFGDSLVTIAIAYFYFLIFFCLLVEYAFMRLRASDEANEE